MTVKRINAYSAQRYIVACRSSIANVKVFQIAFAKSDSSLFVAFPYYSQGAGRVGLVTLDPRMTYPCDLIVGENFPVTAHYVKYSHHPTGRAHFSLSGKVRSKIGKSAVPLSRANGHIFTLMVQGLSCFSPLLLTDRGTPKRGVVPFNLGSINAPALKFVAHLHSQSQLALRSNFVNDSPWFTALSPSGTASLAIALATPYRHKEESYYLVLALSAIDRISPDEKVFFTFMGGFDDPEVAYDHTAPTSFLMCIYPTSTDFSTLVREVGTIDAV